MNLFTTNPHQFFLDAFWIVDALNTQLVIDAKHDYAAACVGESDDLLRYPFGIGEFDLQFEERVFTATNQAQVVQC